MKTRRHAVPITLSALLSALSDSLDAAGFVAGLGDRVDAPEGGGFM